MADYYTEGYFKYTFEGDGITILSYFGNEKEVVVPDYIAEKPVRKISSNVFSSNKTETITLPETITDIDENAFAYAEGLKTIYNNSDLDIIAPKHISVINMEKEYADKEIIKENLEYSEEVNKEEEKEPGDNQSHDVPQIHIHVYQNDTTNNQETTSNPNPTNEENYVTNYSSSSGGYEVANEEDDEVFVEEHESNKEKTGEIISTPKQDSELETVSSNTLPIILGIVLVIVVIVSVILIKRKKK